jgi:hypothetical protein
MDDLSTLWPPPRRVDRGEGSCALDARPTWWSELEGVTTPAAVARVAAALARRGLVLEQGDEAGASIRFRVAPGALPAQGYRLAIDAKGIEIRAADEAGLHHGACTLAQWISIAGITHDGGAVRLPFVAIEDWPDLARRGVMLDVSRDKVPTMATLRALIVRLAGWKINELQLYTEHTFAYRGHEEVWRDASPITAEEARELDALCAAHGIELVPNQNSFGHFHRWLRHERYRPLAEVPDGIEHPFGDSREPFSLCPTDPRTLDLLADLYDQLLPNFASRELNVGLDETFDIGKGRSAEAVAAKGKVRVYLEFLQQVHRLVAERGHRMQFWGDIILEQPELIPELPPDALALEWGYEADHPFLEHAERFGASGLAFTVCPGTSGWISFAGRADNALRNVAAAAIAGAASGARGCLVTDWGDHGHLQPLPVAYPGFLAGAGFAWNVEAAAEPLDRDWAALLDRHAFDDAEAGFAAPLLELANAYLHTGASQKNGTALFYLVVFPQQDLTQRRYNGLSEEGLAETERRVEGALAALAALPAVSADAALVRRELTWVGGLLRLACRLGRARLAAGRDTPVADLAPDVRAGLRAELAPLLEEHEWVWLARNRPGGREDSRARLVRLDMLLASGGTPGGDGSNGR